MVGISIDMFSERFSQDMFITETQLSTTNVFLHFVKNIRLQVGFELGTTRTGIQRLNDSATSAGAV